MLNPHSMSHDTTESVCFQQQTHAKRVVITHGLCYTETTGFASEILVFHGFSLSKIRLHGGFAMICPKCSREMGSDKNECEFCGFTFRLQKITTNRTPRPIQTRPLPARRPAVSPAGTAPGAYAGGRTAVQAPPPAPSQPPIYPNPYPGYAPRTQEEPLSIDSISV